MRKLTNIGGKWTKTGGNDKKKFKKIAGKMGRIIDGKLVKTVKSDRKNG